MAINNATLLITPASIFTSSNLTGDAVTTMYFCNVSETSQTISLYAVISGAVPDGTINIIYKNKTIVAGDTYIVDLEKLILNQGDAIFASAGGLNSVVATISTVSI
jgi:hypothetical protein